MGVLFKLSLFASFTVLIFLLNTWLFAVITLSLSLSIFLFYPDRRIRRGIVPVSLFLIITFLGNLFFYDGRVLLTVGPLMVTDESLRISLLRTARVSGLIVGAKLLIIATPVEEIMAAMKRLFVPLERLGVRSGEFFDTASLSLRMLPQIRGEAARMYGEVIRKNNSNNFYQRLILGVSILFPLMIRTIQTPGDFLPEKDGPRKRPEERGL